ncbi:putative disease resistance protein RGA3 [Rosa rugosa]|uniref:putative disease resistance protein RGA3 n=1 Tax=Rosa rugosa TaxID=74645 RepID=UPI002B416D74|nr:putative disease resistance protein RGA3 [Rosa rugosa]XP_062023863.1 putative disease resistance protein RGA3 [Rosa rugosa]XP_062023864.1 putative disease resistance protein RGA3 [Rosa rugosa]XP_062023865.1 putative disease resistance protein RGA3 [Rosa rugosa]XP_062023866.1 putative disease resistance protein RGA3 [Rosa rugosa]XP_062023867.1 putative disease resistance protein RGA3 [Rosa rugosa]XP_062023868.1 putative disease resistance protein RGA3 [Rosa rugosa]XP_062023869.1 putative d
MADALISVLVEKLGSMALERIEEEVRLVLDVKKEIEEFTGNLEAIQAVLEDAEQRQVKDASVRNWLDKLKEVSYKMVDVVDEWNSESLKQQVEKQEREGPEGGKALAIQKQKKKKVWFSIPSHCFCLGQVSRVIIRRDIALKIKDLNVRLSLIDQQRQTYKFQYLERGVEQPERQKTSSFVDISKTFGRENEKNSLISKLLGESQEERGLLVFPIVGMGGMGKTTLAQLVYNDENVKSHFEKRSWVCVSDPFDEVKIAKAIIGKDAPNSTELDYCLQCMSESIKGKRFFLVLDDIWTPDHRKWEQLELPLMQNCANGSRIVVTTRKQEVATMVGTSTHIIHVEELSEQYCLSLFNHHAYFGRGKDESNVFGDIGMKIVKKCKGLPLAAKTLGSLLRNKKTRKEWQDVLDSKIWDIDEVEQQVFQPLLLSYYDLASEIRSCLLYCATFPKDYRFDKHNLIELWMSQDYLNLRRNKEMKKVGHTVFDNLVLRSFFQDLEDDVIDKTTMHCKMHDIVHDFVQFLTKNECFMMEAKDDNDEIESVPANNIVEQVNDKLRHFTLMFAPYGPFPSSVSFDHCKNLRSLATFESKITVIDSNLVSQLKCLRTLNLSHNDLKEVPKEIGELIHLRYLDLTENRSLEELPNTLGNLCNLQTLRLLSCHKLRKLPETMGKLVSLKHLYIWDCSLLMHLPKGIGRLTSMQTLDECPLYGSDSEEACTFGDLGSLNQLQGRLKIKVLGDWMDDSEAEKAHLGKKKQLFHVELDFANLESKRRKSNVEIVDVLQLPQHLESLTIAWYEGVCTWPTSLMSLNSLRILSLFRWTVCEIFPPLGKLNSLEELEVYDTKVKKVGVEFLGIESQTSSSSCILFPKLKKLKLEQMPEWEEWEGVEEGWKEDSNISIMPCLSSLQIDSCDQLKTLPDFLRKTSLLQNLTISGCRTLAENCQEGSGKEWPKISHVPNIEIEAQSWFEKAYAMYYGGHDDGDNVDNKDEDQ